MHICWLWAHAIVTKECVEIQESQGVDSKTAMQLLNLDAVSSAGFI